MYDDGTDAVWKALSDPTRRAILDELAGGALTTGDLCVAFPHLGRTTVMKHLGVLEGAGLVSHTRDGRKRFNHLNAGPLVEVIDRWVSGHTQRLGLAARALKKHAEDSITPRKGNPR